MKIHVHDIIGPEPDDDMGLSVVSLLVKFWVMVMASLLSGPGVSDIVGGQAALEMEKAMRLNPSARARAGGVLPR